MKFKDKLKFNFIRFKKNFSKSSNMDFDVNFYDKSKKITITLYDLKNKDNFFELIRLAKSNNYEVEIIESKKNLDEIEVRKLSQISSDINVCLSYTYDSFLTADNVSYSVENYNEILQKINYITEVTKSNFSDKNLQAMFIINQLANYASFDYKCGYESDEDKENYRRIASLVGTFIDRKTVCAGYALAAKMCFDKLNIENKIILGQSRENENGFPKHAWNQVKLGDNWYDLDLSAFSEGIAKGVDIQTLLEKLVLTDDSSFAHNVASNEFKTHECTSKLENSMKLYEKVKNIKNVLVEYDNGSKSKILQYLVDDKPSNGEGENEREKDLEKENRGEKDIC